MVKFWRKWLCRQNGLAKTGYDAKGGAGANAGTVAISTSGTGIITTGVGPAVDISALGGVGGGGGTGGNGGTGSTPGLVGGGGDGGNFGNGGNVTLKTGGAVGSIVPVSGTPLINATSGAFAGNAGAQGSSGSGTPKASKSGNAGKDGKVTPGTITNFT
ncbi:MAG: hypothetical protein KGS72_26165, partial [Cyanobacteria bacterium REEB67]|nr:hypothetical protein [Cyanobacteria bacterium REEB67]